MSYHGMIEAERARYERAPLWELRAVRTALAFHSWGNTPQEKARAEAVERLVHERLARRMKEKAV